jgi:NADH dehydrogenase
MQRILVIGAGFAGLWSALGAARRLAEAAVPPDSIEVLVVNDTPFHSIRVRNYEEALADTIIPLERLLDPVGIKRIEGRALSIDPARRNVQVEVKGSAEPRSIAYDRLVLAAGSALARPPLPGLAEYAFSVDTYREALRLAAHLGALPSLAPGPARATAVVAGAGATGVEIAAELPERLHKVLGGDAAVRVVLADPSNVAAASLGAAAPVIAEALSSLGVEILTGVRIAAVTADDVLLQDGRRIPSATTIWCAGMRPSPLTAGLAAQHAPDGRLEVDEFLRVKGMEGVFAAGDCARLIVDGTHASVMSCQFARPMGRYAGHNVAADLLGAPMLGLSISWYSTIVDLGPAGAVHTEGWDRHLVATGAKAKQTKQTINCNRIYPPLTGVTADLFRAAAPVVQAPPPR